MKEKLKLIKDRIHRAVSGDTGAGALEAVVIIAIIVVVTYFLVRWLGSVIDLQKAQSEQSVHTGW